MSPPGIVLLPACNVLMCNGYEYFDNTSNISLTVKKVNSRSSHTVGKGKEIKMDLNPNKISTRFRK